MPDQLEFDLTEVFPQLSRAPVVEAVINFRARAGVDWEEGPIVTQIKEKLPDYPVVQIHRHNAQQIGAEPAGYDLHPSASWYLQCSTQQNTQIAVFSHDGCFLSRLKPYLNWTHLSREFMRLWRIFRQVSQPLEIHKMGVRFINRVELPPFPVDIGEFIFTTPQLPHNLPARFISGGFFHQDIILIRGQPHYHVTVDKTIQPTASGQNPSLILDIDVARTEVTTLDEDSLTRHLEDMRWLKNKLFFGTITDKVIKEYQ